MFDSIKSTLKSIWSSVKNGLSWLDYRQWFGKTVENENIEDERLHLHLINMAEEWRKLGKLSDDFEAYMSLGWNVFRDRDGNYYAFRSNGSRSATLYFSGDESSMRENFRDLYNQANPSMEDRVRSVRNRAKLGWKSVVFLFKNREDEAEEFQGDTHVRKAESTVEGWKECVSRYVGPHYRQDRSGWHIYLDQEGNYYALKKQSSKVLFYCEREDELGDVVLGYPEKASA